MLAEKSSLEFNVLPNLLNNAYKFSEQGTQVTLKAALEDNKVVVSVEDQGRGISSEDMKVLFSKKIGNSTSGAAGEIGTGLGLGIVKTYVKLYGGEIIVKPNYPSGTIFKIYLDKSKQD